jgi:hypothetical protein
LLHPIRGFPKAMARRAHGDCDTFTTLSLRF